MHPNLSLESSHPPVGRAFHAKAQAKLYVVKQTKLKAPPKRVQST